MMTFLDHKMIREDAEKTKAAAVNSEQDVNILATELKKLESEVEKTCKLLQNKRQEIVTTKQMLRSTQTQTKRLQIEAARKAKQAARFSWTQAMASIVAETTTDHTPESIAAELNKLGYTTISLVSIRTVLNVWIEEKRHVIRVCGDTYRSRFACKVAA